MRFARRVSFASLWVAALGTLACTAIGRETPPSRFYLLTSLETPAARGDAPGAGLRLSVGPVRVAEYLDRPQMITRSGDNALELAEFDRWGEPLGESITRVLMGDLGALLGTDRVERWRNARHADVSVEVDVQRFDGPASGPVALVAHWRVRRGDDGVERISRISEPLNGSGHAAQAAAMSRALRELSREIVTALAAP